MDSVLYSPINSNGILFGCYNGDLIILKNEITLHMWTFLHLFVYIAFNSTNIGNKESFFRYYEGVIDDNVVIFGGAWSNL